MYDFRPEVGGGRADGSLGEDFFLGVTVGLRLRAIEIPGEREDRTMPAWGT